MHFLQALILWFFVSSLVVGGALVFHRLYPRESPWFGFFLPSLALVVLVNFIEHFVALPSLLVLWPVLAGLVVWLARPAELWKKEFLLPTLIFLGSFAFTFAIRGIDPNITNGSDGLSDLNKINDFCQGDVLPPTDCWLEPFRYEWYYSLQHYAASVVKRLFDLKLGVAYNTTHSLLSAFTCLVAAAIAHRLGNGKLWITIAMPFLIESAATGSSAYLMLTLRDPNPWLADNLTGGLDTRPGNNWIWSLLSLDTHGERLELQVPGFWTWRDEYHANSSGHFLTLLALFTMVELAAPTRTLWAWVMAGLIPVLAVDSSTWAFPITFLLCGGMVALALVQGRRPIDTGYTLLVLFAGSVLIWPSFYDVTSSPVVPDILWTPPDSRAPIIEFLIQWWPILALALAACFCLKQVPSPVLWVMIVAPTVLIAIEIVTIEGRYNTVEKMWGYTYGIAFVALFPIVAQRKDLGYKLLTVVLCFSALVTLGGRLNWAWRWAPPGMFQMDGTHYITADAQKRKMFDLLHQVKHATFLSGKAAWCYNEAPALAVFTENRSYSAWYYFETVADYGDEADRRAKLDNDFYSGAMTNRLKFLQDNDITGVLIWPDDIIPDDYLATLTAELAPAYEYIDCRGNGPNNAGVFLKRPLPEK